LKQVYTDTFGIDVAAANGDPSWTLPMPSRFVIDHEHRIKAMDVNASYTERPEPQATLDVVMS
jgi:peroxiredoxin